MPILCRVEEHPFAICRNRRIVFRRTVSELSLVTAVKIHAPNLKCTRAIDDQLGFPALKEPRLEAFLVKNIFTDFKRHDLGSSFYERDFDGTTRKEFLTTPLWGVGSTGPYGHDGRSINLMEVIMRHGGEAEAARRAFAKLSAEQQSRVIAFLNSLVIFPPDDTASNLDPGNRNAFNFPQFGHGSIKLSALFNNPTDPE